ncbi:MAG: leucine-rich repeat protein [Mycoplasmatales bacterium]|nr:leucine-rich repeat protein [Mycoplasmatales bacterium]
MKINKKFLLSSVVLATSIVPITMVISCGTKTKSELRKEQSYKGKTLDGSFKFSKGITKIKANMFEGATLKDSFRIPNTITEIEANAFKNAKVGKNFKIPEGVTKIGAHAFENVELPVGFTIPLSIKFADFDKTAFANLITKENATFDQWWGGLPIPGSSITKFEDIFKKDFVDATILRAHKGDYYYKVHHINIIKHFNYGQASELGAWVRHGINEWGLFNDNYDWDWGTLRKSTKKDITSEKVIKQMDVKYQNIQKINEWIKHFQTKDEPDYRSNFNTRDLINHMRLNDNNIMYIKGFTHSLDGAFLPKGFYIPKKITKIAQSAFTGVHFNDDFHFEAPENIDEIGFLYLESWKHEYGYNAYGGAFFGSHNLSIDLRKFTKLTDYNKQIAANSFYLDNAKKLIIPKSKLSSKVGDYETMGRADTMTDAVWNGKEFLTKLAVHYVDDKTPLIKNFEVTEEQWKKYKKIDERLNSRVWYDENENDNKGNRALKTYQNQEHFYKNRWFGISHLIKNSHTIYKEGERLDRINHYYNWDNYEHNMLLEDIDKYFKD